MTDPEQERTVGEKCMHCSWHGNTLYKACALCAAKAEAEMRAYDNLELCREIDTLSARLEAENKRLTAGWDEARALLAGEMRETNRLKAENTALRAVVDRVAIITQVFPHAHRPGVVEVHMYESLLDEIQALSNINTEAEG